MGHKITMKDVSIEAGVSTATVARVLHQRGYVSKNTKDRVEKAIETTGFRLNMVAQSLRRSRSMTIGHLLTSIVPNPFFAGIELGVEQEAIRHGYDVLIWNVLSDPDREREGVETFIRRQLDAIIFTTPLDPDNVKLAKQAGIPVIQVERPSSVQSHQVLIDNYAGAVQAMEHLYQLGHERIAFVGKKISASSLPHLAVDYQRLAGWRDSLQNHGITPCEEWFYEADLYSVQDGFQAAQNFLDLQPKITAIFAACDILAAGVLQAVHQRGQCVPNDLSVIGFDDTFAALLSPPLTSVQQPVFDIGVEAVKLAIEVLDGSEDSQQPYRTRNLATRLIVRSSTGAPPR